MFGFLRKNTVSEKVETPKFAYCESTLATPTSPWHIREVGPEGLKLGGGVPNPALCGRDLRHGWDRKSVITREEIIILTDSTRQPNQVTIHQECADLWLQAN